MCQHGTETVSTLPDDIHPDRQNRTVSIDSCIANVINKLWDAKIQTLGCCCGHGQQNPNVVIEASYSPADVREIASLLADSDDRMWTISQWQLVTVSRGLV